MKPTPRGVGPVTAIGARLDVPQLPSPVTTNARQAWPTFSIDERTRTQVAGGKVVMVAVPALFGSAARSRTNAAASPAPATRPLPATTGLGVPAAPSMPIRTAGPGGSSPASQTFPTNPPYSSYAQSAAFMPPSVTPQPGPTPLIQQTKTANTNPDAAAALAARMGWIALACAVVGSVTLIPAANVALGLLIALAFWFCTCLPAMYKGREAMKAGVLQAARRQAGQGQILGWIATAIWVVAVIVAHSV